MCVHVSSEQVYFRMPAAVRSSRPTKLTGCKSKSKEMPSAAGVFLSEACETQSGDETQAHETPHADSEETQGEETHVQAEAREMQTEVPAEETQVQISNNVASQIDDAIVENTQLQIPSPVTPVSLIPLPTTPDSWKRKAVDEQVSPWKSRKLISSSQIQVTSNLNHKSKPIAANPNATTQNHHWARSFLFLKFGKSIYL